tara:strand:+ start:98 stop:805 length:708 start_codon:yes stop_codon:yes gene_type:complete
MIRQGILAANRRRTVGGGVTDPHWANVVLRMNFDQAIPFTDFSASGHIFSLDGSGISQDTTIKKFGTGATKFENNASNVNCPNSADFKFPGDFTMELWLYQNNGGIDQIVGFGDAYASGGWSWRLSNGTFQFYIDTGGSQYQLISAAIPDDVFTHVAIERSGSSVSLFVNGVVAATASNAGSIAASTTSVFRVGGGPPDSSDSSVRIDDLRITKGVARYGGVGFAIPTEAYPIAA